MFPATLTLAPLSCPRDELIDEMLACYAEWRDEVAAVDDAYRYWCAAPAAERDRRFGVYIAALDQEESAAMVYAGLAEQLRALLHEAVERSAADDGRRDER